MVFLDDLLLLLHDLVLDILLQVPLHVLDFSFQKSFAVEIDKLFHCWVRLILGDVKGIALLVEKLQQLRVLRAWKAVLVLQPARQSEHGVLGVSSVRSHLS